jgi:hypothetical protein
MADVHADDGATAHERSSLKGMLPGKWSIESKLVPLHRLSPLASAAERARRLDEQLAKMT